MTKRATLPATSQNWNDVTKSERLCMDIKCGYATYITLGAMPVLLLLHYPFHIAPAVSQGTYEGPVAQALELCNN